MNKYRKTAMLYRKSNQNNNPLLKALLITFITMFFMATQIRAADIDWVDSGSGSEFDREFTTTWDGENKTVATGCNSGEIVRFNITSLPWLKDVDWYMYINNQWEPTKPSNAFDGTVFCRFRFNVPGMGGTLIKADVRNLGTVRFTVVVSGECGSSNFSTSIVETPWTEHSFQIFSGTAIFYEFGVANGTTCIFKTGCGDGATANFDTTLTLYNSSCQQVAFNDDACGGAQSLIEYKAPYNDYYYLKVTGYNASHFGNYTLAFSPMPQIRGAIRNPLGDGISGISVSANNGGETGVTNADGEYNITVPIGGWSGRVTPSCSYIMAFEPPYRDYALEPWQNIIHGQSYTCVLPDTPSNISATDGTYETKIRITWGNVSDETGYKIYRATSSGGSYSKIGEVGANVTTYDDPRSCGGTNYYYKVSAYNTCGETSLSSYNSGYTDDCPPPEGEGELPVEGEAPVEGEVPVEGEGEVDCVGYNATDPQLPLAVVQNDTVMSSFEIEDEGLILDVNVVLDISCSSTSSLVVELQAPSGDKIMLFSEVDNNGQDFNNTVLDDEGAYDVHLGFPPFRNTYIPGDDLSAFDGQSITGTWQLYMTDVGSSTGTLNSWSLCLETEPEPEEGEAPSEGEGEVVVEGEPVEGEGEGNKGILHLFYDCMGSPDFAGPALANLGYSQITQVTDWTEFEFAVRTGDWSLIILDNYGNDIPYSLLDALATYHSNGGHILFYSYDLLTHAGHSLVTDMGVTVDSSYTTPQPVYVWATDSLFDVPNVVPDLELLLDTCNVDGDRITVNTATAVAGYTASKQAGEVAITISPTERIILNAFTPGTVDQDADSDGKNDMIELYENEIYFLLGTGSMIEGEGEAIAEGEGEVVVEGEGEGEGEFTPSTGLLAATIEPSTARTDGAQWRVDSGSWHNSGYTQSGLSVGSHTVSFKDISGWNTPGAKSVTITAGKTTTVTGTYLEISTSPVLSVNSTSRSVPYTSGVTPFSVSNTGNGTMDWTASVITGNWLRITSVTSGTNTGVIMVAYEHNNSTSPRTGQIKITAPGASGSPITISLTQEGQPYTPPSTDDDSGCTCFKSLKTSPLEQLKKQFADWLVVGLSMLVLLSLSRTR